MPMFEQLRFSRRARGFLAARPCDLDPSEAGKAEPSKAEKRCGQQGQILVESAGVITDEDDAERPERADGEANRNPKSRKYPPSRWHHAPAFTASRQLLVP